MSNKADLIVELKEFGTQIAALMEKITKSENYSDELVDEIYNETRDDDELERAIEIIWDYYHDGSKD